MFIRIFLTFICCFSNIFDICVNDFFFCSISLFLIMIFFQLELIDSFLFKMSLRFIYVCLMNYFLLFMFLKKKLMMISLILSFLNSVISFSQFKRIVMSFSLLSVNMFFLELILYFMSSFWSLWFCFSIYKYSALTLTVTTLAEVIILHKNFCFFLKRDELLHCIDLWSDTLHLMHNECLSVYWWIWNSLIYEFWDFFELNVVSTLAGDGSCELLLELEYVEMLFR